MKKILVAVIALLGVAVEAAPILFDVSEGTIGSTIEEAGEVGGGLGMVSPPGLPPGALPSPEGGFVIDPKYIMLPEASGYQWISQDSYWADWLAFVLASNGRLNSVSEEEGVFEFPTAAASRSGLPGAAALVAADAPVPEPSSLLSIVTGGALLLIARRRPAR